jgi:hypothetical protein
MKDLKEIVKNAIKLSLKESIRTTLGDLKLGVNIEVGDHLPEPNSENMVKIYSQEALDNYLANKDLSTPIVIDKSQPWFSQFQIPSFSQGREKYTQRKASWLDRERSMGRTSGLDENDDRGEYLEAMDIWKRIKKANLGPQKEEVYKQRLLKAAKKLGIELNLD